MKLKGRIAIVTGAGDGIGRGIALALAKEGADLAVCARRESGVKETARLIEELGRQVYWENFDISSIESIEHFVANAFKALGPVSILVNNAAVMPVVDVEHMREDEFDLCVDAKFKSAVFFSKYCIPHMRETSGGSIIHMASVTGNVGFASHAVYGACNAALMGLARGQAMELAPLGIRVNSVSPGTVDSPMLHRFIADSGEDPATLKAAFDANHPRGVVGSIEEVAAPFVFLASDDAANITGTDIRCDGGFSFKGGQASSDPEERNQ
ncbi:MAG: SDR family oxidoreductase [Verrucomicrobiota bacterium]